MIIAKDEGKCFDLISAGTVQAVCYAVWDLGRQKVTWNNETKTQWKIIIAWETTHIIENEGKYKGKRMVVSKRYTNSLNEKASLCKDLESWRGNAFTEEERKGFDLEKLIGVNCLLSIVHNESNGKTYANVNNVSNVMAGQEKLMPENTIEAPEWVQKIQANPVEKTTKNMFDTSNSEQRIEFMDKDNDMPWEDNKS